MASIEVKAVVTAAEALTRAGRWSLVAELLDATEPADAGEAQVLAVARAENEVEHAFWMRRAADPDVLATARELATDPAQVWTTEFAQLRAAYAPQLRARLAGEPLDAAAVAGLAATAERLAETAPDPAGQAYVTFYRGLVAGVLQDDWAAGEKHYRAAADTDDEYVRSYALRHLGWVADEAGRPDEARELWRESTRLRQRAGFVPGVLAQLVVQEGGPSPIVAGWAAELGISEWIVQAGVDPDDEAA